MSYFTYTYEEFVEAVKTSISKREVLKKIRFNTTLVVITEPLIILLKNIILIHPILKAQDGQKI